MPASQTYRVTARTLNVRKGPSTTEEVVGVLRRDELVTGLETSNDGLWLRIAGPGDAVKGWSFRKYLAYTPPAPPPGAESPWMPIAQAEQGVAEMRGANDNPRILEYLDSTQLDAELKKHDETAWCSAFVNWCVERAGYEGTNSAWAFSWLDWGQAIPEPRPGCIVVLKRRGGGGHVGFYVGTEDGRVRLLGGNQSDSVRISSYDPAQVLGYRIAA